MKLSLVLREKTEIPHQQLEKLLVGKLRSISTTKDYQDILEDFYGYIRPLEEKISKNIDINALPDYAKRRKSDALKADLRHLGRAADTAFCNDTPRIRNTSEAFGALYVLEGSTLGGKIISRMVSEKLGFTASESLSFFNSYGEETAGMWEKFKSALDNEVPEHTWQQVIDTAEQTFIKFKNWLT